jgi:predicted AAA+ superfamily ATPase
VQEGFLEAVFSGRPPSASGGHDSDAPGVFERVLRGGFPEAVARKRAPRRAAWFDSYVTTILQRDVRDLANIERLTELPRLLYLLAARSSSLLNYSELSRSSGLPQSTLKRYLALLETTFLIKTLPAWSGNLSKRLVRSPKIMLCDTGLAAYLQGIDAQRLTVEPTLAGPLLENFVAMELLKQASYSNLRPTPYHYRTQSGEEIDVLLEDRAGRLVGVEVKASSTVQGRDFRSLHSLSEAVGEKFSFGAVLYTGKERVPFGERLYALPVNHLWSAA